MLQSMGSQGVRHDLVTELNSKMGKPVVPVLVHWMLNETGHLEVPVTE